MSRAGAEDTRGGATQEPHRVARSDSGGEPLRTVSDLHTARDLEDAAAVIAVISTLAATAVVPQSESPRSVWGSPAHRLGSLEPGRHTWWSSGAAR